MGKNSQPPPQGNFTGAAANDLNANRPTQNGPLGSTSWSRGAPSMTFEEWAAANPVQGFNPPPGVDRTQAIDAMQRDAYAKWSAGEGRGWTQNTTLTPEAQAALDAQLALQRGRSESAQGLLGDVNQNLGQDFNYDGLPDVLTGDAARRSAFDAAYGQATSRLDPQWQQRRIENESRLLNQGFQRGTPAWDQAIAELGRQENDAYAGARNQATLLGETFAQGEYGRSLGARQQGIGERLQQRYEPLNAMNALLQGQQVQMPQFPGFTPSNASGATAQQYQADLNAYNAQQAQGNPLYSLLGAGIGGYFGGPQGAAAGYGVGSQL